MRYTFLCLIAAVLVLSFTQQSQAQDRNKETMIDERFSVDEGGMLEINVGDADVEVVPGSSNEVLVEVVLEGRDMERARDYFERQNFEVDQVGNTVRVKTNPRKRVQISWRNWRDHPSIHVNVHVPASFNADLHTSDGDIFVERMTGDIRMKTSDGDVTAGTLSGGNLYLSTSDGDIQIDEMDGETVEIHTSDGDLRLGTITGERVEARTSDGDISASRLSGDVEVKTSDGDIDLDAISGTRFFARTSDGTITVDELVASSSTVRSSDGEITLRGVEGDLNVSGSSADIRLDLRKPGEVVATTSDGDISITLPSSYGADVRLRGDDVRISSSLDFDGRVADESADGELNGGGRTIEARTSDGDVVLRGN